MNLTTEDNFILAASKLNPSEKDFQQIRESITKINDWKNLTDIVIQNGVAPLFLKNIPAQKYSHHIPAETYHRLKNAYNISLARNIILYEHFRNAINAFSKEGFQAIALKGIYFAEAFYKDIGLRQMSDIDILLKEDDAEKCWKILHEQGYRFTDHKKTKFIKSFSETKHLPSLKINGVIIELHTKIFLNQFGFSVRMQDCWERSRNIILSEVPVKVLSPEHQIQHTCIHLEEHYASGKPQLFNFTDLSELIRTYASVIDWKYLEDSCYRYNCTDTVYKYLFLANKYFATQFPNDARLLAEEHSAKKTENLFLHFLKNFNKNLPVEFSNPKYADLKIVKGIKNKSHYLIGDIFPSREFMVTRYKINNKSLVYFYYIKRIATGIKRLTVNGAKKIPGQSKSK